MEKEKGEQITEKYCDLKIMWHPDKIHSLRTQEVTAPLCIRIKPTNRCDHRCFYCSYNPEVGNVLSECINLRDEIPREKMMEILSDMRDIGVKAVTYSGGGEPLLYRHIDETLKKTLEYKIDLSAITNGQRLNEERADYLCHAKWVRISLDSCKPETFIKTRRVPESFFYALKGNINKFSQKKDRGCEFGINFVVNHINADEVYEAAKFFKELGVNHLKLTPRWIDAEGEWLKYHEPLKVKVTEQIARAKEDLVDKNFAIFDTYENDFKLTGVPVRTYSTCPMMQIVPVIGADSIVYFCHDKAYMQSGALGSLKDKSLKELWFSPEAKKRFEEFNPKNGCQQHCTYDSRNILIKRMVNSYGDGSHINFI